LPLEKKYFILLITTLPTYHLWFLNQLEHMHSETACLICPNIGLSRHRIRDCITRSISSRPAPNPRKRRIKDYPHHRSCLLHLHRQHLGTWWQFFRPLLLHYHIANHQHRCPFSHTSRKSCQGVPIPLGQVRLRV